MAHAAMQLLSAKLTCFEVLPSPAEALRYLKEPWVSSASSPLLREYHEPQQPHKKPKGQQETPPFAGDSSG